MNDKKFYRKTETKLQFCDFKVFELLQRDKMLVLRHC